jgi:hypothetical protein
LLWGTAPKKKSPGACAPGPYFPQRGFA